MEAPAPIQPPVRPPFVRWALMLGIVVVLNVFFTVLVSLALPEPKYDDYCTPAMRNVLPPEDATTCATAGGTWNANYPTTVAQPAPGKGDASATKPTGYCDMYAKCQQPYQDATERHALYAFTAMIALGALALVGGLIPSSSAIVSTGLSYGGVLAFIIGSIGYWGQAGSWIRLGIATIALAALIYIGFRRFKD